MTPAFSLLLIAAGVALLLGEGEAGSGYWLCSVGLGVYVTGTRVFFGTSSRLGRALRVLVVVATFWLGWLHHVASPHVYLWIVALWAVGCALLARSGGVAFDEQLARARDALRLG